ncbi:MAG TPA: DUF3015 family protein [Planctomycetota bacterium]|nr:DUF3015 family protein [Planctomycetota bacterium]
MKKLIIPALFAACAVGQVSQAADSSLRSNVGVGFGTIIFEGIGYTDSALAQSLAGSTNVMVFWNQAFFITTGTGGASKPELVQNKPLHKYVEENLDSLARDMAAGQGESLAIVAELAGIPVAQRAAFYAACQSHFSEVFASENVTSDEVVAGIAKLAS